MNLRPNTMDRMTNRLRDLSTRFDDCLAQFHVEERFPGPSLYFHLRTRSRLKAHTDLAGLLGDEQYFEYLYATLTAWGLHRMGPGNAKLKDFPVFKRSAHSLFESLASLRGRSILDLADKEVSDVAGQIGTAIERHKEKTGLTEARWVLVANSKAVHHFLPDLVPPIDRAYTLSFFFGRVDPPGSERETFEFVFPRFAEVAKANEGAIRKAVTRSLGPEGATGWDSSHAKVLDNALIGWVQLDRLSARR